ncbi:hypothetical protein R6Q57_021794 [Mikania cordata]
MTADSSTASLAHSGDDSPSGRSTLPSPWAQVVRGGIDPDSVSPSTSPAIADPVTAVDTQLEGSDGGDNCNAGGVVKSAWSKPLANGVEEGVTSPVMGASTWPALSESTRPGVKSVSESSAKSTADGSAAVPQAPVLSQPSPKQAKQSTSNSHSNPNHNRHRSIRRGGGSAGGASAGHSRPMPPTPPPLPPPFPFFDPYGNLVPAVPVPPQPPFKGSNWSPRPVDHSLNRHPAQRNNFGPRPLNNGYGGRREPRGPRSPAVRDVHIPHQMAPPPPPPYGGFVQPPFIFPRPLRPYGAPMGYEMGPPSYVYFPTLAQAPYRAASPVSSSGASGSSLHDEILKQIEYYFSDDNLVKDNYLRSHMDDEGWVPIQLIAGFRRVQALTNDVQMLMSSLSNSSAVEIQGDKVRRRADWGRWIHTPREITEGSVEEASLQNLTLIDVPTNEEQVLANGDVNIDEPSS